MHAKPKRFLLVLAGLFLTVHFGGAAGERSDLHFVNSLDEEIVSIRIRYATPYDKPRFSTSRLFLSPGHDYRIGVQGTIRPERILVDLAAGTYDFGDISPLQPDGSMGLEIKYENGAPILRRFDSDDEPTLSGTEYVFLTDGNRPNAVDKDLLTSLASMDEVVGLVEETTGNALAELGGKKGFDIEAGPIWDNAHARERCPEVVAEWNAANEGAARWTGQWATTVPGEMSVCNCATGAAELGETLFKEDLGWGMMVRFPVVWLDWIGVARVQALDADDPAEGVGIELTFKLPGIDGVEELLDQVQSDLRVDGFRPWSFHMRTWGEGEGTPRETGLAFAESEGDKFDHQEAMQRQLFAAYADGTLAEATAVWVKEEAFDNAQAGEEPKPDQGVVAMFSQGTFTALFVPDAAMLLP